MLTESEFDQLAEETMVAIEDAVEESGADIDFDSAGGILTLEFLTGSQIIINKQGPLKQLWVAARAGGFHFDYHAASGRWIREGDGEELFECLNRCCSQQAGEPVTLQNP